jgi:hypothetical protein
MTWIAAGLAFGFFGSVHCVGMCGPLALSLPGGGRARWQFLAERLLYNVGRAVTYTLLGGAVGLVGTFASLAGVQQGLSIGVGALMIGVATVPWLSRRVSRLEEAPARFTKRVLRPIQGLYRRGGPTAMLAVGILNGLLPCGFVYAGLATAATAGDVEASMLFMAAFGLGTFPAMLGVSLAGRVAGTAWRARLQRLVPVGLVLVGVLLILRGLSLGIPFVSPTL